DLYQTGGRRKLVRRWTFDGPDKYHTKLLEETGPGGLTLLVEWDHIRSKTLTPVRPPPADKSPKPSARPKPREAPLGHTWESKGEAKGDWSTGIALYIQSTFEWIPYADGVYARVIAPKKDGEPTHLLDAYFYHHTGSNVLHCLALSNGGGVYE